MNFTKITLIALFLSLAACTDELEKNLPHMTADQTQRNMSNAFPDFHVTCHNISFIEVEEKKRYEGMNSCTARHRTSDLEKTITQTFYVLRDGDDWHWKATGAN